MKAPSMLHLRGLLAAFFVLVTSGTTLAAAPLEGPGQFFASVPVPAGLSNEDVKDVVIATLAGRSWAVDQKTDEKVVGYLKHRSNEALVTLVFDTSKVDIFCVGYEINKRTGERKEPEQPTGWLNNIKSDLNKRLNRATAAK